MVSDPGQLINDCHVIVINTSEPEFVKLVADIDDKIIIDFVRLDDAIISKSNYFGINW
jgi:hypothetical protein